VEARAYLPILNLKQAENRTQTAHMFGWLALLLRLLPPVLSLGSSSSSSSSSSATTPTSSSSRSTRAPAISPQLVDRRVLQGNSNCGCQTCVNSGQSVSTCQTFGLDCGCYLCVQAGTSATTCASFGLDCSCVAPWPRILLIVSEFMQMIHFC
jgi:hypothetical protein